MGKIAVPVAVALVIFWAKFRLDEDQFFVFCLAIIIAAALTLALAAMAWVRMRFVPQRISASGVSQFTSEPVGRYDTPIVHDSGELLHDDAVTREEPEQLLDLKRVEQEVRRLLVILPPLVADLQHRVEADGNDGRIKMRSDAALFHLSTAQAMLDRQRPPWRLMQRLLEQAEGCRLGGERLYEKLLREK